MSAYAKGTVHAHSKNSYDGRLTYPELREFLLSRGLSFVCITEHIERLVQRDVDRIVDDCRANSDDRFVFVPGIEMDCFVVYFLGVGRGPVDFTSDRSAFDSLRAAAAMCVCAHPIRANYDYLSWVLDRCDGVEVINTKYDGHHVPRRESERFYERVRARRPNAVALAGMDFHQRTDFSPIHIRLTREGVLSESFVLEALQSGAFALYKGDRPLADISPLTRSLAQVRIGIMDLSHAVHRRLSATGFRMPRGIKRALRRWMEG